MPPIENENLLWDSFLKGDNESLEKIYRTYFDELYRYGLKWLRDTYLVEDTIQDLFIKLIRTRENLSQVESIKFYLFRAFRSVALDKLRAGNKHLVTGEVSAESFTLDITPEHKLIAKEEYQIVKEKINNALSQLTPRQREALYLRYVAGFSYPQISEVMSLTAKGTYKLMARAIEGIREKIGVGISVLMFNEFLIHSFLKIR